MNVWKYSCIQFFKIRRKIIGYDCADDYVAAIWFAADYGTMGINLLINGEAKSLGDIIDEKLSDYCFKLY